MFLFIYFTIIIVSFYICFYGFRCFCQLPNKHVRKVIPTDAITRSVSGVVANLELGERSEFFFPSPPLPSFPLPRLFFTPFLVLLSRTSSPPFP